LKAGGVSWARGKIRTVGCSISPRQRGLDRKGLPGEEFGEDLQKQFEEHGYEILSDYQRSLLKLPPRRPVGWTIQEIHASDHPALFPSTATSPSTIPMLPWSPVIAEISPRGNVQADHHGRGGQRIWV
jgi:hypothetical protein